MRFKNNPLITPADIKPVNENFEVSCVLNPAVTQYQDQILLLMRVAQRPKQKKGYLSTTVADYTDANKYKVVDFKLDDPLLDYEDPRVFLYDDKRYLTTISHLHIARSTDGQNFTIDPEPFITPTGKDEQYGVEDARITYIDGVYYIYYVAVAPHGYSTVLARTTDFKTIERLGIIFPACNKDVSIFPRKINGNYIALHRPDPSPYAKPSMWLAYSKDLLHWGQHQFLIQTRKGLWDSSRIGAGNVPIETENGWLEIYHGADNDNNYSLGLLLLDKDDPSKILFRSEQPFFAPEHDHEKNGFFRNVVFTNGTIQPSKENNTLYMYYGAADTYICGADFKIKDLLNASN
jgi:predicted GH43/DUF377 family glycosyl hydrolase